MLHKYIDNLGDDFTDHVSHLSKVASGSVDAVCKFAKKPDTVRCKFGKDRQQNRSQGIFRSRSTYGKVLKLIVKCAVGIEGIIAENIPGFLRLLAKLRHSLRTRFDERVQFLGGLAEDGHCDGITLGFVFHFAEGIDDFPIDGVAVTHIAFSVVNGNTELLISFGHFVHRRGNGL